MIFDRQKRIIVTDLDGTLLDDSYRWDQAIPSLERLRGLGYPLVLNSSKTLAEIREIAEALSTDAPIVAENGGVIAIPQDSPLAEACHKSQSESGYHLLLPGKSRAELLGVAHELREVHGFDFEGFADWSTQLIMKHTGLNRAQAIQSSQRRATEPILWKDTEGNFDAFARLLSFHGIRVLRGGRFIHLMGNCDKAGGLLAVVDLFRRVYPDILWTSIALGDGPNDLQMLNAADAAAVIPSFRGGPVIKSCNLHLFTASVPGPAGWHESITHFLKP